MPAKKYKILHLDDEETLLTIVRDELRNQGYEAYGMDLKRKGFAWIIENKPDLVISDIKAPEIDGIEFLRMLRSDPRTRGTKVVMLTGVDDLSIAIQAKQLGALDYMTKPFQFDELFKCIERILEPGESPVAGIETRPQPMSTAAVSGKTILMIAQRDDWAPELVMNLVNAGYEVEIAESFEEMLAMEQVHEYDLVILTNSEARHGEAMPELVSYMKARSPQTRLLVMSAYADLKIAVDYGKRGVDDFISIPFDCDHAIQTISRILTSRKSAAKDAVPGRALRT